MKAVDRFEDLEYYELDVGPKITFQHAVKPGAMGLLSAGRVCLEGPTLKAIDTHGSWDQVYIVVEGTGTVIVGEDEHPVGPRMVVRIPAGKRHGVRLEEGERLEYLYANAHVSRAALDKELEEGA
jgi:mannose-6-phosphate isomerase-like protein (cupin superfamily)